MTVMQDHPTSAGVMLIPTRKITEDSHCTVVYAGEIEEDGGMLQSRLRLRILQVLPALKPMRAKVVGRALFGTGLDEPVLLLGECPEIHQARVWFQAFNKSEYDIYKPHIAVPAISTPAPQWFLFDRIALWFGGQHEEWDLCH